MSQEETQTPLVTPSNPDLGSGQREDTLRQVDVSSPVPAPEPTPDIPASAGLGEQESGEPAPSLDAGEPAAAIPPTESAEPGEITASRSGGIRGALGSEGLQAAGVLRAHEAQAAQDTVLAGGGIMADTSGLSPVARERAENMATHTPELVGK